MSFQDRYQKVVEKIRALWAAFSIHRILKTMSQLDPTRTPDIVHNRNGAEPTTDGMSLHGGAADGLPVAAPHKGSVDVASNRSDEAHDGAANGNGAGYRAGDATHERVPKVPANDVAEHDGAGQDETAQAWPEGEKPALLAGDGSIGLTAVLESLLFVAGEPVEVSHLAKSLDLDTAAVKQGLTRLAEQYKAQARGLRLQVHNGRYQLVTAPTTARFVEDFLNIDISTKLSSAALETLAIVAYRQPVTRVQIEAIRGVDCSGVLRSLVARGLIEEVGRLDAVGRPIVYGVTELFMQHFGLTALEELPPLAHEEADMLHAATALAEEPEKSNGDLTDDGLDVPEADR